MYVLKAVWNVFKKSLFLLIKSIVFVFVVSIGFLNLVCLMLAMCYLMERFVFISDSVWWNARDRILINIGLLETIVLLVLFFVIKVRKEYKKLVIDNGEE